MWKWIGRAGLLVCLLLSISASGVNGDKSFVSLALNSASLSDVRLAAIRQIFLRLLYVDRADDVDLGFYQSLERAQAKVLIQTLLEYLIAEELGHDLLAPCYQEQVARASIAISRLGSLENVSSLVLEVNQKQINRRNPELFVFSSDILDYLNRRRLFTFQRCVGWMLRHRNPRIN